MTMHRLILPLFLLAATAAQAADYRAGPGSTLGFSATYQDEAFAGKFATFTPQVRFDPANLAASRIDVSIDLASASTDNAERDEMLLGSEFFDAARAPTARYLATSFRALGDNRFVAEGTLSLRGVSQAVPLTFTWTAGQAPVLAGEASLSRLAFNVGIGDWTDTELLPDQVTVRTRLVLEPVATP
jgi:polyisoprenoid-binding protein YceI